MILDQLNNGMRYAATHPRFAEAFHFLQHANWEQVIDGKIEIDGDQLFILVATTMGRGRPDSPLEFHQRYIDIQFVIEGADEIGWRPLSKCEPDYGRFSTERDIGFTPETPSVWLPVHAGQFAIFFPDDAHAPLAGKGRQRKAVVKVNVE